MIGLSFEHSTLCAAASISGVYPAYKEWNICIKMVDAFSLALLVMLVSQHSKSSRTETAEKLPLAIV